MDPINTTTTPIVQPAIASAYGKGGPQQALVDQVMRQTVATMQNGSVAMGVLAATSARVAERQANFRVVMQSRIDGIKAVQDLSLRAIQKSGTQGG